MTTDSRTAGAGPGSVWQPIETCPGDGEYFFWIVPKTPEESWLDSAGHSIFVEFEPGLHRGSMGSWSSLSKATHWMPLPAPPITAPAVREEVDQPVVSTREKPLQGSFNSDYGKALEQDIIPH